MQEQKRSVDRKPFNLPVTFETSVIESEFNNARKTGLGVDISPRGLGLNTDQILYKGEVLKVSLPVDAIEATLPVYAEVMWTKPEQGRYRAGLRFLI